MRLSSGFATHKIDDTQYLVPVGAEAFCGVARGNRTAAYIVELLREETTEENIVDAMCERYDAPREVILTDVREILSVLRGIHALEE